MVEQLILHTNYLTPHKLVLLVILTKFCNYEYTGIAVHMIIRYLITSIQHFDEYKEPTLGQVMTKLAAIENEANNESIVDPVRERISQIQNPESIDQLIGSLMDLLLDNEDEESTTPDKMVLDNHSVFGMFVRRCRVEYLKLSFERTSELFAMFNSYRYGYSSFMSSQSDEHSLMGKKSALDSPLDINADYIGGWVSNHDMARFLDREARALDKNGSSKVKPFELHDRLAFLQRHAPELVKACHVRFLSCIRIGEYEGALENLHRFFDYCLLNREIPLYQYALLNLAILEHTFGHKHKALAAITEALDVARENHDEDCLSQALSWLTFIESKHNTGVKQKFVFGEDKAKNKNIAYLKSMDLLWDIKRKLQRGDAPAAVHENLLSTSAIGTMHSLDRIFELKNLLSASTWNEHGNSALVDYYIHASLDIASEHTPVEQIEVASCMLALQYARHGNYSEAQSTLQSFAIKYPHSSDLSLLWKRCLKHIQGLKSTLKVAPSMISDLLITQASSMNHQQTKFENWGDYRATSLRHNLSPEIEPLTRETGLMLDSCMTVIAQADISMDIEDYDDAIERLQECLKMSAKCHSVPLYCTCCMKLADICIRQGQYHKALQIVDALFPKVLGLNSSHLTAYTHLLRCKALFGLCISEEQLNLADKVTTNCDQAMTGFSAIQCHEGVKEALSIKMLLFNKLGHIHDRDVIAHQLGQLLTD
ncbi:hypothetical protein K450DRAFT_256999 [Umbelopsis ramanniana AG]|uniref:Anaphase-promoting complex subunit 5 n=1 Tax=Umbelopsis ramanniana AG TaxID=1314678 RepID=A0AAD5H9X8_UMBRA|nr:uncharacterized protein K450DRAFT_256999 [Umbelopsis ramanniana AG]KAI8576377.1 hypothetical protein K450DRAFT_256999 [Umbelopsis ramanniana AG]